MASSLVAVNMSDVVDDAQMKRYFTPVCVLGRGGFGTVFHAINLVSGQECALKVLRKSKVGPYCLSSLRKEADILSSLQHPNIVAFRGLRETQSNLYLELEIVSGGTLADLMDRQPLTDLQAAQAMTGLFRAVQYLHAHGIVHRDLKPQNILVGDLNDLTSVKVADFGLSQQLGRLDASDVYCGTMPYMAPEQIERRYYGKSVDMWSCGIIMAMLCCGRHPLKKKSDSSADYLAKLRVPQWNIAELTPLAQSLFLRLVRLQPIERYSPAQALKHPWILRDSSEVPLTSLELFRAYNDEVRTRKVLWAIFFLGKLAHPHSSSQLQTEASSDSPVLPSSPVPVRSFRIHRTPSAKRRVEIPKTRPPSRRLLRESPPKRTPSRQGILKPVSVTRRSNASFSVS